jgi:hypothetical protein
MWRLAAFSGVFLAIFLSPAMAAENTDWFHQAGWGIMTHYLGAPPSSKGGAELTAEAWNQQVDAFDLAGLVDQVASTGAKYLLFTIGQNSGHYCAPNATYDRLVGIQPSKCSRRDLVADLSKALAPRGIRLMVYMPNGAPAADPVARKALGWRWGRPGGWQLPGEEVGGRLVEFQRKWEAISREWSLRWGKGVSGWWIDGCYFADEMYRHPDAPNFKSFADALKAGNPGSLVAFNPGVMTPVISHTEYEDYTAGEISDLFPVSSGPFVNGVRYHILSYLGERWGGGNPRFSDEFAIGFTKDTCAKGGVVTWDMPISPEGKIPNEFLKQFAAINRAVV